jgi:hypothetical protein
MANARVPRRRFYGAPRWLFAVVVFASAIVKDVDAAPATETTAPVRPIKAAQKTPPKAPQKTPQKKTEKTTATRTPRRAAKESPQPLADPATSFTNLPLLIVYDPSIIGIGGPCPGDSDLARAECALAQRDFKTARAGFLESWNLQRSPFAAMRLGDLSLLEGEQETALDWYELVTGSVMIQKMTNLRRCEIEVGCGVSGRNLTRADSFTGPFGNESLLRTARIYTRSGFPDLAASILIDGDGRGCDIAPDTCVKIAALALEKSATASTVALSLSMRKPGDGQDPARIVALRKIGMDTLADDLKVVTEGGKPAPRTTQRELALQEERAARLAQRAAKRAEAEARRLAESASTDAEKIDAAKEGDAAKPDAAKPDAAKPDAAKPDAAKPDATKPDATKPDATKPDAAKPDAAKPDATKPDAAQPAEAAPPKKTPKQEELDRRMRRDAIDAGLKNADESIEKARRLMEVAGGALPLGGPE